uniref:vomeronasal type-1 receptor 3-like n=1 Tax=Jaculus jaculus TaxID=51337 RepID=UPI001E1B017C|nr:vomeronasal type-1 receptor 3-like [Jaculus jaculus]
MTSGDLVMGMIFLWQMMAGFLGNLFLLCYYNFLYFTRYTIRSTDLILKHLTLANLLVILSKGVPQTMSALGLKHFLGDAGCKLVFYAHRVGRGVCMGITCLLSTFQAITICPRSSRWAELKVQASKYLGPANILCWILNILVNSIVPVEVGKWSGRNGTNKRNYGFCSAESSSRITGFLLTALFASYDILCLGLTVWASGFMVFILHRHKHQVQHVRAAVSPTSSPESRVTRSILMLMGAFVAFYTLSFIFSLIFALSRDSGWLLINASALITACFPTVSPFILMKRDPRLSTFCYACCKENSFLNCSKPTDPDQSLTYLVDPETLFLTSPYEFYPTILYGDNMNNFYHCHVEQL